jgi:hypothetical protein
MRKNWIWFALAVLLLTLGCMPYLLSVQPFKQIVVRKFERRLGKTVKIDHVRLSWLGPQKVEGVHFSNPQIDGTIEKISAKIPFWSLGSFEANIEEISGWGTTHVSGQKGRFTAEAHRLPSKEIAFQFSAEEMPTATVFQLLKKTNSPIQLLIGPSFNAKGTGSIQETTGKLDLDLTSPQLQTQIRAFFTPDAIGLREPVTVACYLTPEFTQAITDGALSIQSKTPARLQIETECCVIPRPFSLAKLRIRQATLDLGQIILQHANLAPLATLLKADSLTASQIDMWLTSVDWSLQDFIFSMGRIDALLADSVHLSAWGKANLQRQTLDMIFGIPADTLSKTLRMKSLPSNFVLQIPVTGSMRQPNIDTASAGAKMAVLIAGNRAESQGGIFGGIAGIISKMSQEKSPPPKRPFPWE